ncbi:hypothetical protein KKB06_01450 [Patescibacteria group bacterium]|nr:hypothetical protein [Patescibacteria group bacterium]
MKKLLLILASVLMILFLPIPWYNPYNAVCYPCSTDKCPPCPEKGWEFKKPFVLQLLSLFKLSQSSSFNKKAVINGGPYKNYQQCVSKDSINPDNCYRLSAIANNDPSICSYIQDTSTTQYLRNNCILINEVVNSSVLPLICKGLDENVCKNQEGCLPEYIAPNIECPSSQPNCVNKTFVGCDINAQYFCTKSGGTLNEKYECACSKEKTTIKPYGCFDCEKFSSPIAKAECIKMTNENKGNDKLKQQQDDEKRKFL